MSLITKRQSGQGLVLYDRGTRIELTFTQVRHGVPGALGDIDIGVAVEPTDQEDEVLLDELTPQDGLGFMLRHQGMMAMIFIDRYRRRKLGSRYMKVMTMAPGHVTIIKAEQDDRAPAGSVS